MRSAKIKDVWRDALKNKSGAYTINSIVFKNIKGIGDKDISFPTMITALCGENGVGKTTLLKNIFATLAPRKADSLGIRLKPQNVAEAPIAVCEITAKVKGDNQRISMETFSDPKRVTSFLGDESDDPLVSYVDAAANAQRIIHLIGRDADFPSLLDGAPELIDSDLIKELRREITGRNYSSIVTCEVEDYNDLPVFPYFRVSVGGTNYGSEEMGLGELCANYLIWILYRCKEGSLILLEEPESHLPPRAQERLMAHIAEISVSKKFNIIVSTHSQHTLANIPNSHIAFLGRLDDKFIISRPPALSVLYESLKIATSPLSLLILEDHSAFAMLNGMIEKIDPSIFDRVDFTWKNGYSYIDEILFKVPRHQHGRITLLGIYDGDQIREPRPDNLNWPYLFLPGDKDPIAYLVEAVKLNVQNYAKILGCNIEDLELAIANLSTVDIKEFFLQLKKAIRIDLQSLYNAAADLWLSNKENEDISKEFIDSLKVKLF